MSRLLTTIFGTFVPASESRLELLYDYEKYQFEIFFEMLERKECNYVVDVGANIGAYSIRAASLDRVEKVYSFEPAPDSYDVLISNVALQSHPKKVEVRKIAVSDQEGTAALTNISPLAGNRKLTQSSDKASDHFIVETQLLDKLVPLKGCKVAVKIDVEGSEVNVLKGAEKLFTNNSCCAQVECFGQNRKIVKDFLRGIGYKLYGRMGNDMYFAPREDKTTGDFLTDRTLRALNASFIEAVQLKRSIRRIRDLSAKGGKVIAAHQMDAWNIEH